MEKYVALMNSPAETHIRGVDSKLARFMDRIGPCPLKPRITARSPPLAPFAALVRTIVYQQLNGRAAQTILGRLLARFANKELPAPEILLETPEEILRAAGLSRSKSASIRDIAAKAIAGVVPSSRELVNLSDDEILARLTVIRGVGPWTVHMLLMFDLGRPDVLPATDYGVRQGFQRVYGKRILPQPALILKFGDRWRPYRSVASWYFWRVLELQ